MTLLLDGARLDLCTVYTAALCFHTLLYIRTPQCVSGWVVSTLDIQRKIKNEDKEPEYFANFEIAGSLETY